MKLRKTDLEVVYAFRGYMVCAGNEYLDPAWLPTTIITGNKLWTISSQPLWVRQGISQPGGGEGSQWHGAAPSAAKALPAAAQGLGPEMIHMEPTNSNGRQREENTCGFPSSWKERNYYKANYYIVSPEREPWDSKVTCQVCAPDIQPR